MENKAENFEEYKKERYEKLELEFLKKSGEMLNKNFSANRKNFIDNLRKAISDALKFQTDEKKICAYISISFLNTSMFDFQETESNSSLFQIDFYNADWFYGESWSRSRFSADFLLEHWQKFIFQALDENYFVRSKISTVEIKSLFWETLDKLIYIYTCQAKYFANLIEYSDEFDELKKAENFYITCGTYLDWSERIFGILPEIDLLNLDANEETTFRPVKNKIYRGKEFSDLNLRNCYFEDCLFDRFTFSDLILADAHFLRCRFTNSKFLNVKCPGADFFECSFRDCEFENCTSEPTSVDANEYFANLRLYHCSLLNVNFTDCDFNNMNMLDCIEKNLEG